jgi:hypothetical protein
MPTPVVSAITSSATIGSTSAISVTASEDDLIIAIIPCFRFGTGGALVSGVASNVGGALSLVASRLRASDDAGGANRLGLYAYMLPNAAAGSHTITTTFVNGSVNYASWCVIRIPGMATVSPDDIKVTGEFVRNTLTLSIASGANLAQSSEVAFAVACGMGNNVWNGSTAPPLGAPSGWTGLAGSVNNSTGVPVHISYQETSSVAALSASWVVPDDSIDDGSIVMMLSFKTTSGTNYVEILMTPDTEDGVTVNATTGWIVHVSAADPKDGYTVYSGISAQATGNEIRLPGAAGSVAVGGTVNVQVINAGLGYTSGWGVGTVRAAA